MKLRTTLVAALSAAALIVPMSTTASASASVSTPTVQAAPAPRAGSAGGAASAKLGKPVFRELQSTSKRTPVKVKVTKPRYQKVSLQRKDSGKWRTVYTTRAPRAGASATVKLKVPAKAGTRAYRVVLSKSSYNKTITSKSFKFFQSDSKKHAKYIAKARKYMKKYCPTTPIYIDSPNVKDSWAIGMAWTKWSGVSRWTGTRWVYDWQWTQTIELASGQDDGQLRHTAIHECAHIIQARPIGKSQASYDSSVKTTNKVFKAGSAAPQEQQADCMASAITGSTYYNYYTDSCTGSRAKNAKSMWKKWGLKYQDPEYKWTTPAY